MPYTRTVPHALEQLEEAECLLGIAQAQRDIRSAEKHLVDCRLKEVGERARLYRIQAAKARKGVDEARKDVGRARRSVGIAHQAIPESPCRARTPSVYTTKRRRK